MAVNSVGAYTTTQLAEASSTVTNDLDKDAFLKLLIAELSNQDPLNPMDDREFISQMAQFTSLEQMTNVAKGMESLANMQQYSAVSYVGMEVAYNVENEDGTISYAHGTVVGVHFDPDNGTMLELLDRKELLPLKQITGVTYPVISETNPDTETDPDDSDSEA